MKTKVFSIRLPLDFSKELEKKGMGFTEYFKHLQNLEGKECKQNDKSSMPIILLALGLGFAYGYLTSLLVQKGIQKKSMKEMK